MRKSPDKKHPGVERLSDAFLKAKTAVIFHVVLLHHAERVRGKARSADKNYESGNRRNEKASEERITHKGATTNGRSTKIAPEEPKKSRIA